MKLFNLPVVNVTFNGTGLRAVYVSLPYSEYISILYNVPGESPEIVWSVEFFSIVYISVEFADLCKYKMYRSSS